VSRALNEAMFPVYWKWNRRVWVTRNSLGLVHKLFLHCSAPFFVTRMSYQPRLFFSWIIPPGHPTNFSEVRPPLDVSAVYMPSNSTSLFQPIDQGVLATIKAYYLHQTLSFGQVRQNYQG
jgi:hypothetical protein